MKRIATAMVSAALLVLCAGACDDEPRERHGGGRIVATSGQCAEHTTCGTCTPVLGCGWCETGATTGACVDDPSACPSATTFGWTWEPAGCPSGGRDASLADASVAPNDAGAGTDAPAPDAADASPPADARPDVF